MKRDQRTKNYKAVDDKGMKNNEQYLPKVKKEDKTNSPQLQVIVLRIEIALQSYHVTS